jgi:hypothetical protein
MEYHIVNDKVIIASFINECDRDVCLHAFKETYTDCKFVASQVEIKESANEN